ncbi:MAG: hypothetical protein ABJF11_05585 [Reichenbachiella sp.]|uniref:hypothetical protein n=1 Tax=Reichenbachiella sp. TaxID=2184521 RepID=UPI0032651F6F
MTKTYQYLNAAVLGLITVLFSMCNTGELDFDNIETPNLTSHNSLVIGQTTYKIKDLIEKLEDPRIEITEDNANLLSISYRDTTFFNDYLSIVELEDISNPGVIDASLTPIAGSPTNQDVVIPTQDLSFEYSSPNNEELDSVVYSAGTIALVIENGFNQDIEYELTLTDVVNRSSGDPMVLSGTLPANGTDNVNESLVGFKTIIVFDNATSTNLFSGQFDGILKVKTGDFVNGTEFINYTLSITDADFSEIFGWFGNKTIDIESQSIDVDFFEGISENSLEFGSPEMNFYVENSFGVPMGLNLSGISASNAEGSNLALSGDAVSSPQLVRAPGTTQVGSSVSSIINVDETNSNLRELLGISPNLFEVTVDATANYNNDSDTGDRNFVSSGSEVEVITEINLPLIVKMNDVQRDFGTGIEGFDFEEADTINLVLTTVNQMPFEGTVDMQFLAADSSVLFEFTDIAFLQVPEIPVSGKIEEPITTKDTVSVYRENGYQELLDASILNIVTHFTTFEASEDTYVKIFSDYELILKVGAQVNVNYEF